MQGGGDVCPGCIQLAAVERHAHNGGRILTCGQRYAVYRKVAPVSAYAYGVAVGRKAAVHVALPVEHYRAAGCAALRIRRNEFRRRAGVCSVPAAETAFAAVSAARCTASAVSAGAATAAACAAALRASAAAHAVAAIFAAVSAVICAVIAVTVIAEGAAAIITAVITAVTFVTTAAGASAAASIEHPAPAAACEAGIVGHSIAAAAYTARAAIVSPLTASEMAESAAYPVFSTVSTIIM